MIRETRRAVSVARIIRTTVVNATTRKWIDAAKAIGKDGRARIRCPECDEAELELVVVERPDASGSGLYLRCPSCLVCNVMSNVPHPPPLS